MSYELAQKIIEELRNYDICEKITLHLMGEPLLHPEVFNIIAYAKQKGCKVGLTTNGSLFNRENIVKLSQLSLDQINISVQTPDRESFQLRRATSVEAEEYFENILNLIARLLTSKDHPIIKIHLLNTKPRRFFVTPLDQRITEINPPERYLETLAQWVDRIYGLEVIPEKDWKERVFRGIRKISLNKWNVLEVYPRVFLETYMLDNWGNAMTETPIKKAKIGYCPAVADHFGILWNGELVLCCRDFDGQTSIGSLAHHSLPELLNSTDLIRIIKGFRHYRVLHPYCQRCLGGSNYLQLFTRQIGSILLWKFLKPQLYVIKRLF